MTFWSFLLCPTCVHYWPQKSVPYPGDVGGLQNPDLMSCSSAVHCWSLVSLIQRFLLSVGSIFSRCPSFLSERPTLAIHGFEVLFSSCLCYFLTPPPSVLVGILQPDKIKYKILMMDSLCVKFLWISKKRSTIQAEQISGFMGHIERSQLKWFKHLVRTPPGWVPSKILGPIWGSPQGRSDLIMWGILSTSLLLSQDLRGKLVRWNKYYRKIQRQKPKPKTVYCCSFEDAFS